MSYLNRLIENMNAAGVDLIPCSSKEINEIESLFSSSLPKCYVEFLEHMGKATIADKSKKDWYFNYPGFEGTSVFYPTLKYLNDAFVEQLNDEGVDLKLPENSLVFYDHQGYISAFFKLDEGDNPPVYGYMEGFQGEDFPMISESLSVFYERHLTGDKSLFEELMKS